MQIRLTQAAKADLSNIRAYTRRTHGDAQATSYMMTLRQGLKSLRANPEIGYAVDHIRDGYRCYAVEHHLIFYRLKDTHIIVLAILHERQLPLRHLSQRRDVE